MTTPNKDGFYGLGSGNTIRIDKPKVFSCSKHGDVESTIHITLDGKNDHYCMSCWVEWIAGNITKVEAKDDNSK